MTTEGQQSPRIPDADAMRQGPRHSRRAMLQGSLGLGAAALAGGFAPAAAGAQATPVATPGPDGRIPGGIPGVPDAYPTLPEPFVSSDGPPGAGGTVSAMIVSYVPAPPSREENRYWQELERRLGVTWDPILVPADAYNERLATTLAGGDLPDLMFVARENPTQLQTVAQGAYLDQTPYLTGESLASYPNLQAYPSYLWENSALEGKLYGVPLPQTLANFVLLWRRDWAERLGFSAQQRDAEEFRQVLLAMTQNDPNGNGTADSWGLSNWSSAVFNVDTLAGMFRVPNEWRLNDDGTLTSQYETDEYRQFISYLRELYAARVYHPDTTSFGVQQAKDAFVGSQIGGYSDGIFGLPYARQLMAALDPTADAGIWVPPGFDGGQGVAHNARGVFGVAAMPATLDGNDERIAELLRILDYLASPFGSEEWRFLEYGLEGVHHTIREDGVPVRTEQGERELSSITGIADPPVTLFFDTPGTTELMQQGMRDHVAIGINDPTLALFSPAALENGAELDQFRIDRLTAIITGREPLSALDDYAAQWRSRGGDQIREDYEEALAAQ